MELESVIHDLQILPFWTNFESFIRPLRPFDSLPPVSSLFWQPMYRWISHCTSLVFAARSTFVFLASDWHISYIICDFTACSNNIKAILSRCSALLSVIVEKDFSLYIICICDQWHFCICCLKSPHNNLAALNSILINKPVLFEHSIKCWMIQLLQVCKNLTPDDAFNTWQKTSTTGKKDGGDVPR